MALSHFPTLVLTLGYIIFWIELYWIPTASGYTSPLAFILLAMLFISCLIKKSLKVKFNLERTYLFMKLFLFFIIVIAAYKSLFPPHLMPEMDALNYHYTLPRQHLIQESFSHLPWSTADLFYLPLQFSLAPYWFATSLPNKFPQFFFMLGLWAVTFQLAYYFAPLENKSRAGWLAVLALAGSHGFAIQYGTAMLDIVICYLFLAFLHSLINKNIIMASIELSFFMWSKTFLPIQITFIFLGCFLILFILKKFKFDVDLAIPKINLKKLLLWTFVFGFFIGGPFVLKSLYYAGTPAYPIAPGLIPISSPQTKGRLVILKERAKTNWSTMKSYGGGKSPLDFLSHPFRISVPSKGVNNEFDYPFGLPFIIFLFPFLFLAIKKIRQKKINVGIVFVLLYWGFWWFGSQQTRFLYIPVTVIFILMSLETFVQKSKAIFPVLIFSIIITSISMLREIKDDFGKQGTQVLRTNDHNFLEMNQKYLGSESIIEVKEKEAAFATFRIQVNDGDMFVLPR